MNGYYEHVELFIKLSDLTSVLSSAKGGDLIELFHIPPGAKNVKADIDYPRGQVTCSYDRLVDGGPTGSQGVRYGFSQ